MPSSKEGYSPLVIDDSAESKLINFRLKGWTEQAQYEGRICLTFQSLLRQGQ